MEDNFYFVCQEEENRVPGEKSRLTGKAGPDIVTRNLSFLRFHLQEGQLAEFDKINYSKLWSSQLIKSLNLKAKIGKETLGIMDNERGFLYIYSLHEQ